MIPHCMHISQTHPHSDPFPVRAKCVSSDEIWLGEERDAFHVTVQVAREKDAEICSACARGGGGSSERAVVVEAVRRSHNPEKGTFLVFTTLAHDTDLLGMWDEPKLSVSTAHV